ncbi:MAG: hypothetical protein GY720_09325 [bacterium]|nr:hypothetical protein [bacterium]
MPRIGDIRLTIRHLFLIVPIAGLAWAVTSPLGDNSFLWHVRAGTEQLDRGRVLTTDPFSIEFLGDGWRTQSWLADILFGSLERATGGIGWAPLYTFIVAALAISFVLAVVHRRSLHLGVTAAAALVVTWQALPFTNSRPVLFSYLLLAAVAAALRSNRVDWAIPALIWLWAALHGSFVLGVGLVVLEAIRRRSVRHVELAAAGAVLATFTAHGIGIWQILLDFLSNREALGFIQEWQPPDYSHPFMIPYALVILSAIYAASRGRLDRQDLIVVLPFLFFGMLAVRNIYPAMIIVLPYALAGFVPDEPEVRRADSPLLVGAIALLIVGAGVVGLVRPVKLAVDRFPPEEALALLDDGPLFHGIGVGGYLIYAEWPERNVLVDDRAELFGADGFERYLEIAEGKGWEAAFSQLGISQALLDPDWALADVLATAGWTELYRDEYFVVAVAP